MQVHDQERTVRDVSSDGSPKYRVESYLRALEYPVDSVCINPGYTSVRLPVKYPRCIFNQRAQNRQIFFSFQMQTDSITVSTGRDSIMLSSGRIVWMSCLDVLHLKISKEFKESLRFLRQSD